jgi:uncharacterized phage protein gp47/JayE
MTIPRKTAKEVSDEIISQLETSLNTTVPLLDKSFIRQLSKAIGGNYVLLYMYSNWILLQQFVKTASNTEVDFNGISLNPLQTHGDLVGIIQGVGQRTELTVEISVISQGGTITSGEQIVNPDTQMIYVVVGDVSLDDDIVTSTIRATVAGVLGNVDTGSTLSFVSPPSAVEKDVTVTDIEQDGVDPETTEAYRERILERWMARPQGGSYADYKNWAEEVTGVRNAFVYSGWGNGGSPGWDPNPVAGGTAGMVFVYIEDDVDDDGVPTQTLLDTVAEYIEGDGAGLANRRPVNAYVKVLGITRTEVDVEISGLTVDLEDDTGVRDAIEEAIEEYLYDRYPGGQAGYTVLPPRRDIVSQTELGGIVARVAGGYSGFIGGLTITIDGSEEVTYYLQEGERAKPGTISWT